METSEVVVEAQGEPAADGVTEQVAPPASVESDTRTWPIDVALRERGARRLNFLGRPLTLERVGVGSLRYSVGDKPGEQYVVGVSESADTLRFIPALGASPLLIFPQTRLICPADATLDVVLAVPVYLQLGIGQGSRFAQIDEIAPPKMTRALYGPVDSGRLCRSVRSVVYAELEDAIQATGMQPLPQVESTQRLAALPVGVARFVDEDEEGRAPKEERAKELELLLAGSLTSFLQLRIRNASDAHREVTKIMVPTEILNLYQREGSLLTSRLTMKLLSAQEAEISAEGSPASGAVQIAELDGKTVAQDRRTLLFLHSYKAKTGLEFGF